MKIRGNKGITLIALVVTIIILIILAAVSVNLVFSENGLIERAKEGSTEMQKQAAAEKMNLKITGLQIGKYTEEKRMPTLQELADTLCEDDEMEYVVLESKKEASLDKIIVGSAESIFTKLKKYPYEFEINSSLQLASIDGIKVATNNTNETVTKEEYESLKATVISMQEELNNLKANFEYKTYNFENEYIETYIKKTGNVKEIKMVNPCKQEMKAGTAYELGTLPEEYRPVINVNHNFIMGASTTLQVYGNIIIYTNGEVVFTPYNDRTTAQSAILTLTYL